MALPGCYTGLDTEDLEPWDTAASVSDGESSAAEGPASGGGPASSADGGSADGGSADGGSADGGSADGGSADGGSADGNSADGGSADSGSADAASADGGTTDATADGGSLDGGSLDGGTTDGGGAEDVGSDDGGGAAEVPDIAFCDPVADWMASWSTLEQQILDIVNQRRSEGADCGAEGSFGPAGPLSMSPALRCAARVHSKDMVDQNYFAHDGPDGDSPGDRIDAAGYSWSTWGENIAAGNATAAATMDQWMNSDGHCANLMNPSFSEIGVGYYPGGGYGHYWTQAFGHP